MLFISSYTKNTGYEKESRNLIHSLECFDLKYDVVGVDNLGSWIKNCHQRVVFIKNKLYEYKDIEDRLVWIDADAIVREYPILFKEIKEDIGIHYCQHKPPRKKELLGGTIFINNNERSRKMFNEWIKINKQYPKKFAQINLQRIVDDLDISIYNLPSNYVKIFDLNEYGEKNVNPVIEHFQASRRFKDKINKEGGGK